MKHIQLAIASIVDANTGSGLVHGGGGVYREHELHSRAIRSNSVHALLGAIGSLLRDAVAGYRERRQQRKAVEALSQLNDHYLEDIGLTRGDIIAVRLGQTSLEELDTDRRARLAVAPLEAVATDEIDTATRKSSAVNEAEFVEAKCS